MARIEGEIVIGRPVDVVFDFVADQRNERRYNQHMIRSEKVTDGPVGEGTRFRSAVRSMGRTAEMLIEYTRYQRPVLLASTTVMDQADMTGTLTFGPDPGGTRMRWSWQVRPKGAYRLLAPVIARMGRRQERDIWTGMKRYLEATPMPAARLPGHLFRRPAGKVCHDREPGRHGGGQQPAPGLVRGEARLRRLADHGHAVRGDHHSRRARRPPPGVTGSDSRSSASSAKDH